MQGLDLGVLFWKVVLMGVVNLSVETSSNLQSRKQQGSVLLGIIAMNNVNAGSSVLEHRLALRSLLRPSLEL